MRRARRTRRTAPIEFTLLLSIPCLAAFFVIPELIMRALFMRGAFTEADAVAAGRTLAAYAFGLLPFVLIRSTVATFFARGDTATPVKAALIAAAVNIAFKFLLMGPLAQVGLALATSIGAWINLGLVVWFAMRAGHIRHRRAAAAIDDQARGRRSRAGRGAVAVRRRRCAHLFADWQRLRDVAALALLAAIGGACLWWHCAGAVRPALACGISRAAARLKQVSRLLPSCCRPASGGHSCPPTLWGRAGSCAIGRYGRYLMNATGAISSFSLMRGARMPFCCARLRLWS